MNLGRELLDEWEKLKRGQLKWLSIKSRTAGDESSPLIPDQTGPRNSTHADLWASIPKNEPRVILYDLQFSIKTSDGTVQTKNKILLISWVPHTIVGGMKGIKLKMVATSATLAVKDTFQIGHLVQATSEDEFSLESFLDKAKRFERDPFVSGSFS
eukprot:TRINITY_DN10332_c0_g1_i4.p1 TRINITY_DN10332_c0_g1~~TRINITY_DN10332_c0_g1_i4.p1  ORF type:complete len:156 (-),score=21.39 TRINITY_DN10332_c0_g1_i4:59-526(-)